jgi:hypothetical protein
MELLNLFESCFSERLVRLASFYFVHPEVSVRVQLPFLFFMFSPRRFVNSKKLRPRSGVVFQTPRSKADLHQTHVYG